MINREESVIVCDNENCGYKESIEPHKTHFTDEQLEVMFEQEFGWGIGFCESEECGKVHHGCPNCMSHLIPD